MVDSTDPGEDGLISGFKSLSWLIFAALVAAAAGYGAYYKLGGFDTPTQKAGVVGATLLGFGVAIWVNNIARIVIYAAVVVLALWGATYWYFHT